MLHSRLLQLARTIPGLLMAGVAAGLVLSAVSVATALVVAQAVVAIYRGDWSTARTLLIVAIVLAILRCLLTGSRAVLAAWIAGRVRSTLRRTLLQRLAAVGATDSAGSRAGVLRSTVTEGVDSLSSYYSIYLPQLVVTTLVPPAIAVGVATVHWPSGMVLGVAVVIALVGPRIKDAELVRVGRLRWTDHFDLAADYLEALQAMPTLRSLGAAEVVAERLDVRSQRLYRSAMRELIVSLTENGITALAVQLGSAAAVVLAAAAVGDSGEGARTAVLVLLLAIECFRPVRDLATAWHAGYLGVTAIDGIDAILGTSIPVPDNGNRIPPWRHGEPPRVELDQVSVRYAGAGRDALDAVSATLPAGSVTALVGRSGAGKTTLARLLLRLRDPGSGAVRVDGIDLRDIALDELRVGLGTVEQHPFLLPGTIADNLRLVRPDADESALWAALRAAGAEQLVAALPDGLRHQLTEDGGNFSGGQRQRLVLARTLLGDPKLLILDEVTSHLDEAAADVVTGTLLSLRGRCTTVLIVHRLATAMLCDHVLVLDDGRLVQDGNPTELAGLDGPFAELLLAQTVSR